MPFREHTDERGRHELADEDQEQERPEELLRTGGQPREGLAATAALGPQRRGARPAHARQARLRYREERSQAD